MQLEYPAPLGLLALPRTIGVVVAVVLTAAVLPLTAGHALAQVEPSFYSADSIVVFQSGGLDSDVASGAAPVTISSSVNNINGSGSSTSETGQGYMKLFGSVSAVGSKGTSGTFGGMFIEFRDLQIRRVDGQPFTDNATATLQYFTTFNASWGGGTATISDRSDFVVSAQISQPSTGLSYAATDSYSKMFSGATTGTPGQETLSGSVKGDTPLTLRFSFGANGLSAGVGKFGQYLHAVNIGFDPAAGRSSESDALLDASGSGPVFLLPEGLTVDSPSMGLFDNHWQGVPEPASLSLLAMVLLTLRRQPRRRPSEGEAGFTSLVGGAL
jgi:hypothetical protein